MKVFESVKELRAELDKAEQSGIGFVPTMGALHAGHRSLVERARRENGTVVVSVFVNPTQFNDKNDLKHYPRTPEADARLLEEAGASIGDIMQAIVYLRDPADYENVQKYISTHYPELPHLIVLAPVCRPGWLIETECVAIIPADLPQYPCL